MPNWCENVLEINVESLSDRETVKSLITNEEGEFSLNTTVPMPEGLYDVSVTSGVLGSGIPNWYDWSVQNWGTKWDVSGAEIVEVSDTELRITFDSAWSPIEAWVGTTSEVIPFATFTLSYLEEGMDFSGAVRYRNGESIVEVDYEGATYAAYTKMGFTAETIAYRLIGMEEKIEEVLENEEASKEVFEALIKANEGADEYDKMSEELLAKVKKRIAELA